MPKIKNIDQLRSRVLDTFDLLAEGEIDVSHAACIAKLSETIISGLKTQMEYARLTNSQPHLPFLGNCTVILDNENHKNKLLSKIDYIKEHS
jgi:hypothetical protein